MSDSDTGFLNQFRVPKGQLMNLKNQLKMYLKLKEMTAAQLARKSNVAKQSLSGWIAGSNPRDVNQVKRVADTLGVSIDNLMFGTGEEAPSAKQTDITALLGDEWVSGVFELKIRRVKK